MPTKKISDLPGTPGKPCLSRDHNPPGHIVLEPGVYEHTCSRCGKKQRFTVARRYSWRLAR
jgi:hypothetical protein